MVSALSADARAAGHDGRSHDSAGRARHDSVVSLRRTDDRDRRLSRDASARRAAAAQSDSRGQNPGRAMVCARGQLPGERRVADSQSRNRDGDRAALRPSARRRLSSRSVRAYRADAANSCRLRIHDRGLVARSRRGRESQSLHVGGARRQLGADGLSAQRLLERRQSATRIGRQLRRARRTDRTSRARLRSRHADPRDERDRSRSARRATLGANQRGARDFRDDLRDRLARELRAPARQSCAGRDAAASRRIAIALAIASVAGSHLRAHVD